MLASFLAFAATARAEVSARRRAQARATYERALHLRASLEAKSEDRRQKSDYLEAIRTFREVYRLNPAYSKAPAALAAVAQLYEQMGRVFTSDRYFYEATRAYDFLISQYSRNPAARDAALATAEIYQTDLENAAEARKAFQKFLDKYPKSPEAPEARRRLKDLERLEANRQAGHAPTEVGAMAGRPAPRQSGPGPALRHPGTEDSAAPGPAQVTAVRRWVGPNYSRIVIGLEGDAKFDTSRLSSPDRIVLDLANTRLSPALTARAFPVEDGFLRQIRVAQYTPSVTRVVLDVEKIEDYSIFTLPNPFRLVVDIHGTATTAAAKPRQGDGSQAGAAEGPEPSRRTESPSRASAPTAESPGVPSKTASLRPGAGATLKGREPSPPPATPAAAMPSGGRTLTRALGLKIGRVVIDAGHGGHDTGTIGPTGLCEKDVVLDVALRLKGLLERQTGSAVVLTRNDDTFIPLEERTAVANQHAADLFISIHANASQDHSARGLETYYLNFTSDPEALEVAARENATSQESVHQLQDLIKKIALAEKVEESRELAKLVQREERQTLTKAGNAQRDRGVKRAPFVVLIGANMPSILAEISFLTNPRDERLLKRPEYRQKIAEGIYQGVTRYVNTLARVSVAGPVRAPRQQAKAE